MATFCYYFLLSVFFGCANSDYILTVHLAALHNPNQVLVTNDCCVPPSPSPSPTNQSSCVSPCNTTLKMCVRPGGFDQDDFSCPLTQLVVAAQSDGEWRTVIPGSWMGSVQLYVTVLHDQTAIFGHLSPNDPVVGDLIDSIFIEEVVFSPSDSLTPLQNYTGFFGVATAELSFRVACTYDFFGENCDLFCPLARNDSLGRYGCDGNGSRVCLEGYRDLDTNCTACVPLNGCSDIGGTCTIPGECVCHPGYSGPTCSENDTMMVIPSPSLSPTSPELVLSTSQISALTLVDRSIILPSSSPGQPYLQTVNTTLSVRMVSTTLVEMVVSPTPVSIASSSTPVQQSSLTVPPLINMLLPTVPPLVPNRPSFDTNKVILSSIFAALLLMIAISLTIFLISLSLTYWKKRKVYNRERTRNLYTQRSQPEGDTLANVTTVSNQRLSNSSHSDLGQSLEDIAETVSNPTYSTFLDDSGAFTQETFIERGVSSDDISPLAFGTRQMHRKAELEQSIELKFEDVDSLERSNGEDLLGSIQHSLSQVGGFTIKNLSTNNDHLDSVDLGSDYAPSFIYTDLFAETEENNSAFHTPSLSLETAEPV